MTMPGAGVDGEEDVEQQDLGEGVPQEGISISDKVRRGKRARRLNQKIIGIEWPSGLSKENGPCVA
jgi:hypothetical protein